MPTRILLGPDFEDFTMTSENFRWLHACRWEASHSESFLRLRSALTHSLGKTPNLVKSKNDLQPETKAQWLLVDENEEVLAWAELQSFPNRHDDFGLLLWGQDSGGASFDPHHLTRLMSFSFLVGKFDHLKVGGVSPKDAQVLAGLAAGMGEMRATYVLRRPAWYPVKGQGLLRLETFEVAREEWIASPLSGSAERQLVHVANRIDRFEKAQAAAAPKRKRRSLLARLFQPRLDDSTRS